MAKETKDKLKGAMIVPFGLSIILVPFSILIGWNGLTLILFWFVLTPGLTIYYMPLLFSQYCVVNQRGAASGKGERRLQIHPTTIDNPSAF